jgi:signal transduction histidine kinase
LLQDFNRQGRSLTENLALNAELGLLLEDEESLQALGQNLLKEDTVQRVRILNADGKTVVDAGKDGGTAVATRRFLASVVLSRPQDDLSVFMYDRRKAGSRELGSVEVTYSQKKLIRITKRIKRRIYTFAFFAFLVGGVLACYLSWIILKPVKRLVQASKAIAAGDWEMRVEESGDDEIGELTRDFNRMAASLADKRRELEESYQELSRQERMAEIGRFSTIVAHELKNPLGIIRGSINILGKKSASQETQQTMVKYINEEVTRLNQLAEEFLVFARPPLPKRERVDLGEMANKVRALAEAQGDREKGVSINVDLDGEHPAIYADKNQLFQALLNLLENGVQSAPKGGVVTITFRAEKDGATIEISDNGPGVKAEDKEKIFEPFFSRKEKGTGLGLSIAKRIVEVHDGRISLCDSSSGGACFTIWLPKGDESVNK